MRLLTQHDVQLVLQQLRDDLRALKYSRLQVERFIRAVELTFADTNVFGMVRPHFRVQAILQEELVRHFGTAGTWPQLSQALASNAVNVRLPQAPSESWLHCPPALECLARGLQTLRPFIASEPSRDSAHSALDGAYLDRILRGLGHSGGDDDFGPEPPHGGQLALI